MFGDINPIRYKGYYFDKETGFYWINNRYYDPETGRFISSACPTTLDETKGVINGTNLYVAHRNNPTMFPPDAVQVPAIDLLGDTKDTNGFRNICNIITNIGNELNHFKDVMDYTDIVIGGIDAVSNNKLPSWLTRTTSWLNAGIDAFTDTFENIINPKYDLDEKIGHTVLDIGFNIGKVLAVGWVSAIVGGAIGGVLGAIIGFGLGLIIDAILEKLWIALEDKLYDWFFGI